MMPNSNPSPENLNFDPIQMRISELNLAKTLVERSVREMAKHAQVTEAIIRENAPVAVPEAIPGNPDPGRAGRVLAADRSVDEAFQTQDPFNFEDWLRSQNAA